MWQAIAWIVLILFTMLGIVFLMRLAAQKLLLSGRKDEVVLLVRVPEDRSVYEVLEGARLYASLVGLGRPLKMVFYDPQKREHIRQACEEERVEYVTDLSGLQSGEKAGIIKPV